MAQSARNQADSAERYARSLIEASLDPLVVMVSPEGKITDVNEATIRVTGVARDELVGTDFSDYFTEPDQARAAYGQVFAQGSVTDYPLTIRHTGGALTDVLYNGSVYKDAAGNVLGVFAAARDVTVQKRADARTRGEEGIPGQYPSECYEVLDHRKGPQPPHSLVERGSAPQLRLYGRGDHRKRLQHSPHT